MKKLALLWNNGKGIRIVAVILALISFFSLFVTVGVTARLRYAKMQYDFAAKSSLGETSFFNSVGLHLHSFGGIAALHDFIANGGWEELITSLSKEEGVESLGSLAQADATYERRFYDSENPDETLDEAVPIEITLISRGMLEIFPTLKELMPFDDPSAAYLLGDCFPGVKKGESLDCFYPAQMGETEIFPFSLTLAGRLPAPMPFPYLNASATTEIISVDMITTLLQTPHIFLLDTPENAEFLKEKNPTGRGCSHKTGFFIKFADDVGEERRNEILSPFSEYGNFVSMEPFQEEMEKEARQQYSAQLPFAGVLLGMTCITYISMIVLTIQKRRRETAVAYLCGATRRGSAGLMVATFFCVMLIPAILNLLYIFLAPYLIARGLISGDGMLIDGGSVLVVLLYCLGMLCVAGIFVYGMMGRKSPITYYKEATK